MKSDLLLDANFLVLPFQFNIEIFDEFERLVGANYQAYTLDRTVNEALNLEDGKYHQLVDQLIELKDIAIINARAEEPVDEQLISFAEKGFTICTNDKDVKRELHNHKLPHIYLRQKNHLEGRHLEQL